MNFNHKTQFEERTQNKTVGVVYIDLIVFNFYFIIQLFLILIFQNLISSLAI